MTRKETQDKYNKKRKEQQRIYRQLPEVKTRLNENQKRWYKNNASSVLMREKMFHEKNPNNRSDKYLKCKYGMSFEEKNAMLLAQEFRCSNKGCGYTQEKYEKDKYKMLCVDHDHNTNKIRGLLCQRCNTVLGMMGENSVRIRGLADYNDFYKRNE